ncbi:DUF2332 family protein [Streptomyces syringium]|uniref:DUF2332 family protein n=1 Tax=Streptomyces syringium TaxID=76729 RepID=UPI0034543802
MSLIKIVDLGASAGLNLLWDRYAHDYGGEGNALPVAVRAGRFPARSGVLARSELHPVLPDLAEEFVLLRSGIDAVDLHGGSVDPERSQPRTAPIIMTAAAEAGHTSSPEELFGPHRLVQ